ncbi:MAG: DEAD/DEAH box helicase, partial [bacterium]
MFKKTNSSNRNNRTRGAGSASKIAGAHKKSSPRTSVPRTGGSSYSAGAPRHSASAPRSFSTPTKASNSAFTGVYGGSTNKSSGGAYKSSSAFNTRGSTYGAQSAPSSSHSSHSPARSGGSSYSSSYGAASQGRSSGGYSSGGHSSGHSYNSRASSRDGSSFGGGYSSGGRSSGYSSGGSSYGSRGGFSGGASRFGGGASRFGGRGGFSGGRGRPSSKGGRLDFSKFVNKATVEEKVEEYVPEHAFADFKIEESLKKNVIAKGYVTPSPIQDKAIPHLLRGEDLVGIANTGTGKTAAFLLPLINKMIKNPDEQALIMAPTRELAIQIEQELLSFIKGMKIWSVCCVGGAPIGRQISELKYFNNFIIGTPGRLKDLIDRKKLNLSNFKNLVLDEADRMLDMGFINDMKYVMSLMPAD